MNRPNHCGPYIRRIHNALEKIANNTLRDQDLTIAQIQLLTILQDSPDGEYPLKQLEKLLAVSQATTAGLVKRLEQKGFVEGYTSADDKRVKLARITDSGRSVRQSARADMDRTEQQLTANLTDEERSMLVLLLKKVSSNLVD